MNTTSKKVVLAFSGGLDTSFCALYLAKEKALEVHAVCINTGGFSANELVKIEQHALQLGVTSYKLIDVTESYYQECIRFLIFGNILKNNTYPLSVSAERVSQAVAVANYALIIEADYVAHGSTGAGNDQVRFDMIFNILIPEIGILTPIRELQLSREAEISYLKQHGVIMNFEKAAYSINKGLWGTSVGGKETLHSNGYLPEAAFPNTVSKVEPEQHRITFEKGEPVALNGKKMQATKLIQELEAIASPFGIGRDIHVGDTIIGIKGRVGFEAAAAMIIIKSHHALEKHVLTKWQLFWKDQLSQWYGNWLHEGQFLDPTLRNIEAFLESTQATVSGEVFVCLHPYRFVIEGIESKHDLMADRFGSYGEMNKAWTGQDVQGFAKIFGNQTAMFHQINSTHAIEN